MRFDFVGLAKLDVDATAVRQRARHTGRKVLIRVSEAFVMLVAILVLFGIGSGVAMVPENGNELFPLVIGFELLKGRALGRRDDQGDILFEPARKGVIWFHLDLARFFVRRFVLFDLLRGRGRGLLHSLR